MGSWNGTPMEPRNPSSEENKLSFLPGAAQRPKAIVPMDRPGDTELGAVLGPRVQGTDFPVAKKEPAFL